MNVVPRVLGLFSLGPCLGTRRDQSESDKRKLVAACRGGAAVSEQADGRCLVILCYCTDDGFFPKNNNNNNNKKDW